MIEIKDCWNDPRRTINPNSIKLMRFRSVAAWEGREGPNHTKITHEIFIDLSDGRVACQLTFEFTSGADANAAYSQIMDATNV